MIYETSGRCSPSSRIGFTLIRTRLRRNLVNVQGFTLIELLVVVSIMGILFAIGLATYNEFNRRQTLNQALSTLRNDLRQAQNKALAGEKPAACTSSLNGYRVDFTANTYSLKAICPSEQEVKTINLPSNVNFSPVPTAILFKVLAQGVDGAQMITLTGFGRSLAITVSSSGDIN